MSTIFSQTYASNKFPLFNILNTGLLDTQALPPLQDTMLKSNKKDFLFLVKCSYPKLWGFHFENYAKMPIREMASMSNEAFTLLLLVNYWSNWSTKKLDLYRAETAVDAATMQKKKVSQLGEIHKRSMGLQEIWRLE